MKHVICDQLFQVLMINFGLNVWVQKRSRFISTVEIIMEVGEKPLIGQHDTILVR